MSKLGLIAGSGRFPLVFARAARDLGHEVVAIAVRNEALESLAAEVARMHWLELGEFQRMIDVMKAEGIGRVVMAGKIHKTRLYNGGVELDERVKSILANLKDHNDDSILKALVDEIEKEGMTVLDSFTFVADLLPDEGDLTGVPATPEETEDILYGRRVAREIARLDIGQTVIVRNKAVIAVEAIEGTDEAIRRGGRLGQAGVIVVKVAKPNQDKRFDMPVIGLETVRTLAEVGAGALVIDAGKTIFLDRPQSVALARERGIKLIALKNPAE